MQSDPTKKTEWNKTKESLESFKRLSRRPRTPTNVKFYSGSIIFLAPVTLGSSTCTLYSLSLSTGIATPLLDQTPVKEQQLTPQQILLRERMRTTSSGVTSFSISTSGVLVFSLGVDVFSGQVGSISRVSLGTGYFDPKIKEGVLAYVKGRDLCVDYEGKSYNLTESKRKSICYGVPEYINQEEFDRC
jgi:hypothetical protein